MKIFLYLVAISSFFCTVKSMNKEWNRFNSSWIFSPGITASHAQLPKYCTKFTTPNKVIIQSRRAVELIDCQKVSSCNYAEISFLEQHLNPISYVFSKLHGFMRFDLIYPIKEKIDFIWPDGVTKGPERYSIVLEKINLGQQEDLAILTQHYLEHLELYPDHDVVLYGSSRGAAAAYNWMALIYPTLPCKRIKAVILEGCFDSVENIILQKSHYKLSPVQLEKLLKKLIPGYCYNGLAPIRLVEEFVQACNTYAIPVFLITSKIDTVVPAARTHHLAQALLKAGLQDFYCMELKKSRHPWYMMDHPEDSLSYITNIHAFYKKYNLSHIPYYADLGQEYLETYRLHAQ